MAILLLLHDFCFLYKKESKGLMKGYENVFLIGCQSLNPQTRVLWAQDCGGVIYWSLDVLIVFLFGDLMGISPLVSPKSIVFFSPWYFFPKIEVPPVSSVKSWDWKILGTFGYRCKPKEVAIRVPKIWGLGCFDSIHIHTFFLEISDLKLEMMLTWTWLFFHWVEMERPLLFCNSALL